MLESQFYTHNESLSPYYYKQEVLGIHGTESAINLFLIFGYKTGSNSTLRLIKKKCWILWCSSTTLTWASNAASDIAALHYLDIVTWGLLGQQTRLELHLSFFQFSSVQFSRSVVCDSLRPHESQHARPPCPSPTPGVHSNSRPSSPWCHPAISSSVVPFSSCPQSLPASQSFPKSQLFTWGGQSEKGLNLGLGSESTNPSHWTARAVLNLHKNEWAGQTGPTSPPLSPPLHSFLCD